MVHHTLIHVSPLTHGNGLNVYFVTDPVEVGVLLQDDLTCAPKLKTETSEDQGPTERPNEERLRSRLRRLVRVLLLVVLVPLVERAMRGASAGRGAYLGAR